MKMNCLSPVVLKSGVVVPCGKCELCRSDRRNDWSIRLAIHLMSCDYMPMFITLTYDDCNLPYMCEDWFTKAVLPFSCNDFDETQEMQKHWSAIVPTLYREDVSKFLKAYKRKYHLTNDLFQYFGCGEYGDRFGRPHYHLLFFGDYELFKLYHDDSSIAEERLSRVWNKGRVHVGIAGYDGIHYVTKYCLKEQLDDLHPLARPPFTIASNGLGTNYINSPNGKKLRNRLEYISRNHDEIIGNCPWYDFNDRQSLVDALTYFDKVLPRFELILDDGRKVFMPRALRRKLVGQFEYFKDSPYWLQNHLRILLDSHDYYKAHGVYDQNHKKPYSYECCLNRVDKIRKRLLERMYNLKQFEK